MKEMREEMVLMQKFDHIFTHVQEEFHLTGNYNPYNINHECLRETMEIFQQKCGRFSDYGLFYVKFLAEACESVSSSAIESIIDC